MREQHSCSLIDLFIVISCAELADFFDSTEYSGPIHLASYSRSAFSVSPSLALRACVIVSTPISPILNGPSCVEPKPLPWAKMKPTSFSRNGLGLSDYSVQNRERSEQKNPAVALGDAGLC